MGADFKDKVTLGRTGLKVSRLGIAANWGIGGADVERAFHEYGINYYYFGGGKKEGIVTAVRNIAPRERDNIVVAVQSYDHLGFFLKGTVEKSLRKMKIDYADILILGWYTQYPPKRIMDRVTQLKEQGKIRFIGISSHNRKAFGRYARDPNCPIDVFMFRYNAVHTGAEQDIFPYLPQKNRPGTTNYTATAWRKLMNPKNMPPGEKPLTAADCYRFVLSNPNIDVCLTGPANMVQLNENLTALDKGPLSDDEMKRVRKIGAHIYGK
jgi:aryl-alcohol dehydrogenase-like predicted oxidoreductase